MNFLNALVAFLKRFGKWALKHLKRVRVWSVTLINKLSHHVGLVRSLFRKFRAIAHRVWKAIHNLRTSRLWLELKKWYAKYQKWYKWFHDHLVEPLQRLHRQVQAIYNTIFGPIVRIIDSVRVVLHAVFFWNKKLSRALDNFFWRLESKLLSPYVAMIKRLNRIGSTITAILTLTGRFDATTFVKTLMNVDRQFRGIKWGLPWSKPLQLVVPDQVQIAQQIHDEYNQYVASGDGPIADHLADLDRAGEALKVVLWS